MPAEARGTDRPRGREAVMAAVQRAAVELLAERGPREITVRGVAERAGVNHALVHRHFGTKEDLIRSVIQQQSHEIGVAAASLERTDVAAILEVLQEHPAYWRVLARTVLDAPEMLTERGLPAARIALAMMTPGDEASDETRATAAVAGSLVLGWLVFGAHLATVLQIEDAAPFDDAVAEQVRSIVGDQL